jgi:hypothetical protein
MKYRLDFYTQYGQFYLSSDSGTGLTFDSTNWTDSAYSDRLALLKNTVVIFTQSYGPIKGEIDILDGKNDNIDFTKYDHVVEGGLGIKSGILQVLNCPNTAVELGITLKPSTYRIRVYSSNLDSVDGDEGNDYYKIEIWPDTNMERKVLKQYIRKIHT